MILSYSGPTKLISSCLFKYQRIIFYNTEYKPQFLPEYANMSLFKILN